MSDIYLEYVSRTAIILPYLGEYKRHSKAKSLKETVTSAELANRNDSGLNLDDAPEISTIGGETGRQSIKSYQTGIAGKDRTTAQILEYATQGAVRINLLHLI